MVPVVVEDWEKDWVKLQKGNRGAFLKTDRKGKFSIKEPALHRENWSEVIAASSEGDETKRESGPPGVGVNGPLVRPVRYS